MTYIRVKKINGRDYAYLVESIKTSDGPRQKVKQYLGKVVELEKKKLEKKDNFREDNPIDSSNNNIDDNLVAGFVVDNSIDDGFVTDNLVGDNLVFSSPRELVLRLAEKELKKYGFEVKKNKLCHDSLVFDPNNFNLRNKKKDIMLKLNDGYLSKFTLQRILQFKKNKESRNLNADAKILASYFLEAGLRVSKEQFVKFYQMI